jgi:hypothetical protein
LFFRVANTLYAASPLRRGGSGLSTSIVATIPLFPAVLLFDFKSSQSLRFGTLGMVKQNEVILNPLYRCSTCSALRHVELQIKRVL